MATEKEYFGKINAVNPNQRLCSLCFKLSLLEHLLVHTCLSLRPHGTPDALGGLMCCVGSEQIHFNGVKLACH